MSESSEKKPITKKLERLISKLKVVKQPKQTNTMIEIPVQINNDNNLSLESNKSIRNDDEENKIEDSERFKLYCQEIEKFMDFVKNNEDLTYYYINKQPKYLEKQLKINLDELQNLLAEINETITNVRKIKNQQKSIKKEITTIKKTVERVKNNEIKELESVVSQCDKDMYNRWSKAKWKIDAMEDLMLDVQGKKVALESLMKLIERCIARVKENDSITEQYEEKSIPTLLALENKIPLPPPLPVPRQLIDNSSGTRFSWSQRRFRAERRGSVIPIRPMNVNRDNEPILFSFNVTSSNSTSGTNLNSTTLELNPSRFSCTSSESTSTGGSNNQDFDVKTDLFGERNRNPLSTVSNSDDSFNTYTIPEENSNSSF